MTQSHGVEENNDNKRFYDMSFYIERIIINNRAPFESIDLTLKNNSVSVLTSFNGKGKTTILSYIVDAWIEMTKGVYSQTYEGRENSYYRVSSPLYDIETNKPSIVYIRFKNDNRNIDYLDIRNGGLRDWYESVIPMGDKITYGSLEENIKKGRAFKFVCSTFQKENDVKPVFDNNIITYFPSYRFELPNFLNEKYKQDITHKLKAEYNGFLNNPIEVTSDIHSIANWILDVVLDQEVNSQVVTLPDGKKVEVPAPEQNIWMNTKKILECALISKYPQRNVRFGIGRRNSSGSRLSIIETVSEGIEKQYCPTIFNLSSGELSVIAIFAEILRQGDVTFGMIPMDKFRGIVLIDEVDKHLHIQLQKEVLPMLFNLFPNIQFIVSSHSPFLNMGLAETSIERTVIYDLDNNGIESSPTTNDVYEDAYKSFLQEKNKFAVLYNNIREQVDKITKPLVITEGKTDIKHIMKAYDKLGVTIGFDILPIKDQPDGCSNLSTMLLQLSKIPHSNKVIGIFDSDVAKPVSDYGFDGREIKNNIYAFCIPTPQARKDKGQEKISIEYLYSDDEIHSVLPDGTRLFFGSEFEKSSIRRHKVDKTLRLALPDGADCDRIVENNGGQAVYSNDSDDNLLAKKDTFAEAIVNDQIAISEDSWENFRPIINIISDIIDGRK